MDLSIIIVNWNSREWLRQCIKSVVTETRQLNYEIVVVDAGSFDGCASMIRKEFPQARFIQSETNCGFARANNVAFAAAAGSSILFLNPDTIVCGFSLKILFDYLWKLPQPGAVGCRLLRPDASLQTSCVQSFPTILNQALNFQWIRSRSLQSRLWGMAALYAPGSEPKEVQAIVGACLMVKRAAFEQVGRFSEDYFMYGEDIDLCYKLRKSGFRNYYVPEATVIHYGGGSSRSASANFSAVMMRESTLRFLRKTRGPAYSWGYRITTLAAALTRLAALNVIQLIHPDSEPGQGCASAVEKWRSVLRWSWRPSRSKLFKRPGS